MVNISKRIPGENSEGIPDEIYDGNLVQIPK